MSSLRVNSVKILHGQGSKSLRGIGQIRSFQHSRVLAVGKESELHEEGRAERVEEHKQEHLKKQKEGRGEWTDKLSSDSESIVKADRGEIKDANATIKQLQEETAKAAEQEKKNSSQ